MFTPINASRSITVSGLRVPSSRGQAAAKAVTLRAES